MCLKSITFIGVKTYPATTKLGRIACTRHITACCVKRCSASYCIRAPTSVFVLIDYVKLSREWEDLLLAPLDACELIHPALFKAALDCHGDGVRLNDVR